MDMTYLQLEQEYTDILDNFWQIYMPIYEDRGSSGIHAALENYFVTSRDTALSPLDKSELISALSQMMTRSSVIQWIALYEAERPVNYILFNTGARLQEMPEDFPYLEKLASASSRMEVYGMEPVSNAGSPVYAYAICGGVPVNMGTGKSLIQAAAAARTRRAFPQITGRASFGGRMGRVTICALKSAATRTP